MKSKSDIEYYKDREALAEKKTEKALNEIIELTGHFSFAKKTLLKGMTDKDKREVGQLVDDATDTFFDATAVPNKFVDNLKDALDKASKNKILSKFTDLIKTKLVTKVEYVLKPRTAAYAFAAWSGKSTAGKVADLTGVDLELGTKYVEQATGFMESIQEELVGCIADATISGNFSAELAEFTFNITEKGLDIATYALSNPDSVVLSAATLLISAKMVRVASEKLRSQDSLDHQNLRDKIRNETTPVKKRELLSAIASDPKDARHNPLMRVMSKVTPIEFVEQCQRESKDSRAKLIEINEKKFQGIIKKLRGVSGTKFSEGGEVLSKFEVFQSLIVGKSEVRTFEDMVKPSNKGTIRSSLLNSHIDNRTSTHSMLKGMNKGVENYAQAVEFLDAVTRHDKVIEIAGLNKEERGLINQYSEVNGLSKGMMLTQKRQGDDNKNKKKLGRMKL